ncbi:MAG: hypothetical protein H7834_05750 [Magnetococcus sp. YQC-9]
MSTAALAVIDPGPFDTVVGFSCYSSITYTFRIQRDDGYLYTPESAEGIVIMLSTPQGEGLFGAYSGATPDLQYNEAQPGLIAQFSFENERYSISFNSAVLYDLIQQGSNDLSLFLTTLGEKTLETIHPRHYIYWDEAEPLPLFPGHHEIQLPYWDLVTETDYPNVFTTQLMTRLYSSIPYSAEYAISSAIAVGRFRFPILTVLWSPTPHLTEWTYELRFIIQNVGVTHYFPHQYIANMNPPPSPPASADDKRVMIYHDLVLTLGIGAYSNIWHAMQLDVTTSFGYSATIPFQSSAYNAFSVSYPLPGVQPPNLLGSSYSRTFYLNWDSTAFTYSTGYWPTFYNDQVAYLVEGPDTRFESMILLPQPE